MKTRKFSKRAAIVGLFVLFNFQLLGQKLTFENIGTRSGLPASEVYHVFEDKKGYIWFFTEFGICKYNGSKMIPVCTNLPVEESAVYAVTKSASGNMYFSNSKNKIYRVYNDKAYRVRGKKLDKLIQKQIPIGSLFTKLFFDDKGTLWINSPDFTYKFKINEYTTKDLPKEKMMRNNHFSVFVIKKNLEGAKTWNSHLGFHPTRGRVIGSNNSVDEKLFRNFLGDHHCSGRLNTAASSFGIYCAVVNKIFAVTFKGKRISEKADTEVISMNVSHDNHLWVCTARGLLEYNHQLKLLNTYFENVVVSDVIFDRYNGMWVSTIGYGVYHCNNISQTSYYNLIRKDERISMLKEVNNELFIGTYSGKLYFQKNASIFNIPTAKNVFGINDIARVNNDYYLSANSGLHRLSNRRDLSPCYEEQLYTNYGVVKLDDENLMLIMGLGTAYYNIETNKLMFGQYFKRIRGVLQRPNGEIFSATNLGIVSVGPDHVRFPSYLQPIKDFSITKMRLDPEGNVWFCTKDHGLYKLDKKNKLKHIKLLPSTFVKNILFLKNKNVIIATNKGGYVSHVSSLGDQNSWHKIIEEELTALEEFEDNVYFGSKFGLFSIDNSKLKVNGSPEFYLRSIRTSKDTLSGRQHKLNRNQNELFFEYDYLDYSQKTRSLHYELKGPISEKGTVNGTQIHLQNLVPGDYVLETYPMLDVHGDKKKKIVTRFSIAPAFWETISFKLIVFLFGSLLILLIYRFLTNRRLQRKQAKEDIERLLNEYRLTALKAQVNPHFMSNSLVAIQNLILKNDNDSANLYLAKFSLLLRSLLDYSNKASASMKNELGLIELYVELEQLRFSNAFRFELDIAANVDLDEIVIPTLITQPFVENAIWHGLLPLKDLSSAKLILKIEMIRNDLKISIIDNGVGRGYYHGQKKKHNSMGTELIVNRIETLNQLYQTTGGKIEIQDLFDEDNIPTGTQVVIVIPELILNELYEGKNS